MRQAASIGGSGSTYLYGFLDANYKKDMSKDQCVELVCSILLQKMQLCPLNMVPMEPPVLTPWRDLAFFVLRQSPKCHIFGNIKSE